MLRIASRFEHALAGEAGDLEQHVCALADELLGNRLASGGIIEALGRIGVRFLVQVLDVGVDRLGAAS